MTNEPESLQEAMIYFADPRNCTEYIAARRWPNGIACPSCGSTKVTFNSKRSVWQCSSHHARRQFSAKVGTVFEDSSIGFDKWLVATWMLANCDDHISSYKISRALSVTQKTAWFMVHRIRLALQDESFGMRVRPSLSEAQADASA